MTTCELGIRHIAMICFSRYAGYVFVQLLSSYANDESEKMSMTLFSRNLKDMELTPP